MRLLAPIVLAVVVACASDPEATSTTEQGVFYCYTSNRQPLMCYPWDPGGDWDWCNGQCWAYEGVGGYCPEATPLEWEFCGRRENRTNRYCTTLGEPRFPHYCVSGEFPLHEGEPAP